MTISQQQLACGLLWSSTSGKKSKKVQETLKKLKLTAGIEVKDSELLGVCEQDEIGKLSLAALIGVDIDAVIPSEAFENDAITLVLLDQVEHPLNATWVGFFQGYQLIANTSIKTHVKGVMTYDSDRFYRSQKLETLIENFDGQIIKLVRDYSDASDANNKIVEVKYNLEEMFAEYRGLSELTIKTLKNNNQSAIKFGALSAVCVLGICAYMWMSSSHSPVHHGLSAAQKAQLQIKKDYERVGQNIYASQAYTVLKNVMATVGNFDLSHSGWTLKSFNWNVSNPSVLSLNYARGEQGTIESIKQTMSNFGQTHSIRGISYGQQNNDATVIVGMSAQTSNIPFKSNVSTLTASNQYQLIDDLQMNVIPYTLGSRQTINGISAESQVIRFNKVDVFTLYRLIDIAKHNPYFTITSLSNTLMPNHPVNMTLEGAIYE